ncbi:MAG: TonB-dependent receptor [Lysobacterales bacterium]
MEVVVVTGVRVRDDLVLDAGHVSQSGPDNSDLLRLLPGGNRNANGALSRISQYRGLFGAQNAVTVDGTGYTSDCPNWMDTPLSSIPQTLTRSIRLVRGLGSVDTMPEGLGGSIAIESRGGDFSGEAGWSAYGNVELGLGSNASSRTGVVSAGVHSDRNWFDASASYDQADDYRFGEGTVKASEYERAQYRFGYGHRFEDSEIRLNAAINRTGHSGTPALPMDMRFVHSEQYSFEWAGGAGPGRLVLQASTLSVSHVMDNFTLRPPPLNPMGMPSFRESAPEGDTQTAKLYWELERVGFRASAGIEGKWESHFARIEDPTNDRFFITNFNAVKRDRAGVYATLVWRAAGWDLEVGSRYNRVSMDAGEVDGDLAIIAGSPMYVQQQRLDEMAAAFNAADRSLNDDQWIAIVKASHDLGGSARLNLGLGRKMRSPSYEERYLWLPLEATAGLADGHTYIGDIGLRPEKSIELTVGLDWSGVGFKATPELFYRDITDFIQGAPSTNETANRFAKMMNGAPPLQYANVDAKMYGADLGWEWQMASTWSLRGNLSYVRGRRAGGDNLYRIAPLSSFTELLFSREDYYLALQNTAAARQDRVAAYNGEQQTPGWSVWHLRAGCQFNEWLGLAAGVENLLDKVYQDHLGGYNRVWDSDVAVGERLYSTGRNYYLRLNASW